MSAGKAVAVASEFTNAPKVMATHEISEGNRGFLNALSKADNINILYTEVEQEISDDGRGYRAGYFVPGTNTVVIDYRATAADIFEITEGHEVGHSIEGSKYYEAFKAKAIEDINAENEPSGKTFDDIVREKAKKYADAGEKITKSAAEAEVIADYIGKVIKDNSLAERMAKRDYGTARLIVDKVKDIYSKVESYFNPNAKKGIDETVRLLERALDTRGTKELTSGAGVQYNTNEYWHPDLSKAQLKELSGIIKKGAGSNNSITDTANWLMTRINGTDVFAIYSTENTADPTMLYEVKGNKAKIERDILLDVLEEIENAKNTDGKSAYVSWVSGSGWLRETSSNVYDYGTLEGRGSNRDVGVLQRQPNSNPSPALRNVLQNLFEIQREGTGNRSYSIENLTPEQMEKVKKEEELKARAGEHVSTMGQKEKDDTPISRKLDRSAMRWIDRFQFLKRFDEAAERIRGEKAETESQTYTMAMNSLNSDDTIRLIKILKPQFYCGFYL